ncbi:MAG: hypothetical protein ABI748_11680, partial [Dokdonella sp.]
DWAQASATWALLPLQVIRTAALCWVPIYLFLMHKRIYRQGWVMAILTDWVIAICYLTILAFGLAGAFIAALAIA